MWAKPFRRAIQWKKERATGGGRARVWRRPATWAGVRVSATGRREGSWAQLGRERIDATVRVRVWEGGSRVRVSEEAAAAEEGRRRRWR